ncbi:MAG: diguanylate cyclase [Pseudomonadota bacterium]
MPTPDFAPTLIADTLAPPHRTILVVDSAPAGRTALAQLLRADYTVLEAATGEAALTIATRTPPHLILLDIFLSGLNGYEVLQLLKAERRTAHIPVIVVTRLRRPEDEERALRLGAADYVVKPLNPPVVRARIAAQLGAAHDRQLLQAMANIDGLTGIANRRQFDDFLASECRRAIRSAQPLSVALIDVDFFKQFNDRYGHAAGDKALRAVAQVLHAGMRRTGDLAARYGGEEFALVMVDTTADRALAFMESLRQTIRALAIPHDQSTVAPILTVSAGIATAAEAPQHTALQAAPLLQLADQRLYHAKAAGRDRVGGGTSCPG